MAVHAIMPAQGAADMQGRHFISLHDYTPAEIGWLLDLAQELKNGLKSQGSGPALLAGKTLAMVFTKSSTRTRVSFETAMLQLGGHALFLSATDTQLGRGEPIRDTARVLSGMVDGIMIRTHAHSDVEEMAQYGSVPVINGLTDLLHPCQALADLLTLRERFGELNGLRVAYIGDGNNVAHSLINAAAKTGIDLTVATPAGFAPDAEIVAKAQAAAAETGARITVTTDARAAAAGAHALYTDTWVSMGQEDEHGARVAEFAGYQVNEELMALARPEAIFLHCLPAYRGLEVSEGVLEGPQSAVWEQAENRLHAQKAILAALL